MTAAVKFFEHHRSLPFKTAVSLARDFLKSLEFHKNLDILKYFIDLCANNFSEYLQDDSVVNLVEGKITKRVLLIRLYAVRWVLDVMVNLLSSQSKGIICEQAYKLSHGKIVAAIGPKLNIDCRGASGKQILFLVRPKILTEVAMYGVSSSNKQVFTDALVSLLEFVHWKSFRYQSLLRIC